MILLSKIAEIHVWNILKSYKKAPISTQILSAKKSNEQHLTGSQFKRKGYVDIKYVIDQNFNENYVDIVVFEPTEIPNTDNISQNT